jgi:hypothetical protein
MRSNVSLVKRFDLRQLGKAVKTDAGFLKCPVSATRVGVFKYYKPDGTVFKELRLPEEVFNEDSMATLAGVPVTNRHPSKLVDKENARKYMIGFTSDQIINREDKFLDTFVTITDALVIDEVEKKGLREVSCGYTCELDFQKGVYDGEEYDAIQRNIRYNHLAVVDKGRAGPQVKLHLDSESAILNDTDLKLDLRNDNSHLEGGSMAKIKLGGAEYDVDSGVAQAMDSALKEAEKKGFDACASEMGKKKMDSESEFQKKLDTAQAKVDELTEENKKLKGEKMDAKQIHELVTKRTALVEKAKPIVKADTKFDDMSDLEIKKAVITAKYPELKLDEKSEEYVQARFDAIIEAEPVKKSTDSMKNAASKVDGTRTDGEPETAEEVRKRNMKADAEAYLKPLGKHSQSNDEE